MKPLDGQTPAPFEALRDDERARYGRHLVLPEVGPAGQARLKADSALSA